MKREEVDSSSNIRCFCAQSPLLARWGVDSSGVVFLHIKVYKQKRLYTEVIAHAGASLRVRCRDCFRWTVINVKHTPHVAFAELPKAIPTHYG
jgi:hypothetical protein